MKKIIFALVILLFTFLLISNVEALVVKQLTAIDLKIPCTNDEDLCGGSAKCNITIIYPNSSALLDNRAMTNSGAYFNFSLTADQTFIVGEHRVSMTCWDGTDTGSSFFIIDITPSGGNIDNGKVMLVIGVLIFFIGLLFFCVYIAEKLDEDHLFLKVLFMLLGIIIFCLFIPNYINLVIRDYAQNPGLLEISRNYSFIMGWVMWGIFAYIFTWLIIKVYRGLRVKKQMRYDEGKDDEGIRGL